jgi:hypothetical protein
MKELMEDIQLLLKLKEKMKHLFQELEKIKLLKMD